jgi:drug/metabolite transporter (DMT)-like permease
MLFHELRGSTVRQWGKVLGGAAAIVAGACLIAWATSHPAGGAAPRAASLGILAAVGAGLLWGTMYIPYRKAYLSGMNPLSFVTVFTFGELGAVFALALVFQGGYRNVAAELARARPALFWLFLGGFCWVLGDLFQQYAAKYIGIGRGIPLSNTNQLWGLAWGALVFGELAGQSPASRILTVTGSLVMIIGAVAISFAEAPEPERASWKTAMERECDRYGLDPQAIEAAARGEESAIDAPRRRWWELLIAAAAVAIFAWLAAGARRQPIPVNVPWMAVLLVASLAILLACGLMLWRRTRFS